MDERITRDISRYSWLLIGRARHLMLEARQKELAPYNISPRQAYVVDILYNLGRKATLAELAKHVDREVNTLSQQMTRMESDGLVTKTQETPKSRLLKFELTEKGVTAYENSLKRQSIKKIMSVLSEEEKKTLIGMMQKVVAAAEHYQVE